MVGLYGRPICFKVEGYANRDVVFGPSVWTTFFLRIGENRDGQYQWVAM
jgi:hypothetical protein